MKSVQFCTKRGKNGGHKKVMTVTWLQTYGTLETGTSGDERQ